MKNIYPWQNSDWAHLQELGNRLPHGLLLKGAKGIGKFDLAMKFAQGLLCRHPDDMGFACGQCPSCHWFAQGSHPDFCLLQPAIQAVEMLQSDETGAIPVSAWTRRIADESLEEQARKDKKPGKEITVDHVRGLAGYFGMSAHQGGKRIVVIYPAEAMNNNAANALLKNLEEPPPGLLFILVSHKPQQLLPTIRSRCLSFALSDPDIESATRWLEQQKIKNPAATLAASGFSPLLAVQVNIEERGKLLHAVRDPATLDVFALAEALQKTEQVVIVQWLQQWSYDLSAMKMAGKLRYNLSEETAIKKLVESVTPLNLVRLQGYLQTVKREAQHTLNAKLFLESLLFSYRQLMTE